MIFFIFLLKKTLKFVKKEKGVRRKVSGEKRKFTFVWTCVNPFPKKTLK